VTGISKPKIEKLEAGRLSVTSEAVDERGLDNDVDATIEEVGGADVADKEAVVEVDEREVTGEVDVREMSVEVIEIETLPVVAIITTEKGKLSSTVA